MSDAFSSFISLATCVSIWPLIGPRPSVVNLRVFVALGPFFVGNILQNSGS